MFVITTRTRIYGYHLLSSIRNKYQLNAGFTLTLSIIIIYSIRVTTKIISYLFVYQLGLEWVEVSFQDLCIKVLS